MTYIREEKDLKIRFPKEGLLSLLIDKSESLLADWLPRGPLGPLPSLGDFKVPPPGVALARPFPALG